MSVPLEDGSTIVVEVDEAQLGTVPAGRPGEVVARASETLEAAMDDIVNGARAIVGKLREVAPTEFTVEFGIKVTAAAGAVFTKVGAEATFSVTMTWKQVAAAADG